MPDARALDRVASQPAVLGADWADGLARGMDVSYEIVIEGSAEALDMALRSEPLANRLTEISYVAPVDLPYVMWEEDGVVLGQMEKAVQWWIGDWLNFGEQAYGEKYSQALEETGLSYSALSHYAWVAARVCTRVQTLSWSHHRAVAGLEPDEQREWLEKAGEQNWSKRDLEKQLRRRGLYSSDSPEWETPQDLFDTLNNEFGFDLDVCATPKNAKCARYFTERENGLERQWEGTCWMNPPYGDEIAEWIQKAYESVANGATVVCLVPARVDTAWWWDYCRFGEIRFLRGRLKFGSGDTGAPFPSAVVVFPRQPNVVWWER